MFALVSHRYFETAVITSVIGNTLVLALHSTPAPSQTYTTFLQVCNIFFTTLFNLECLIKGLTLQRYYFRDKWNCFDFFCVLATDVGIIVSIAMQSDSGALTLGVLRVFRTARLFRIIRFLQGLHDLFVAFFLSLPKLLNVAAVLFLLTTLYALLGMGLFGTTRAATLDDAVHDGRAHFRSYPTAMLTLFRAMTGEAWNDLMHDLARDKWFFEAVMNLTCVDNMIITEDNYMDYKEKGWIDTPIECGNPLVSYTYWISFCTIVAFVVLNLFVAVIFEGFYQARGSSARFVIQRCTAKWPSFDPDLSLWISFEDALTFLAAVVPPEQIPEGFLGYLDHKGNRRCYWDYDLRCSKVVHLRVFEGQCTFHWCVLAALHCVVISEAKTLYDEELRTALKDVKRIDLFEEEKQLKTTSISKRVHNKIQRLLTQMVDDESIQRRVTKSIRRVLTQTKMEDEHQMESELFEEHVAVAKLQKYCKKSLLSRRRPTGESDASKSPPYDGPITRAAG